MLDTMLANELDASLDDVGEWSPEMLDEAEQAAMAQYNEIDVGSSEYMTAELVEDAWLGNTTVPRWMTMPEGPARDAARKQFERIRQAKADLAARAAAEHVSQEMINRPAFFAEALNGYLATPVHESLAYIWPAEVIICVTQGDTGDDSGSGVSASPHLQHTLLMSEV